MVRKRPRGAGVHPVLEFIMFAITLRVVANLMEKLAAARKGNYDGAEEAIEEGRQLIESQLEVFDCTLE